MNKKELLKSVQIKIERILMEYNCELFCEDPCESVMLGSLEEPFDVIDFNE